MSMVDVVRSWLWGREEESKTRQEAMQKRRDELEELLGAESFFMRSRRDDTELKVFIKRGRKHSDGKERVMLVMAPLGQQNMLSYYPLINHFGDEYTYISFQYRGFFESEIPKRPRRVSVRDHAEDAYDVMQTLGYSHADVVMGHSMGVQVALEFVLLYPECATAMVLMNGSSGTVYNQAFQPFFKVPLAGSFAEWLVHTLVSTNAPLVVNSMKWFVTSEPFRSTLYWFGGKFGNDNWRSSMGPSYFRDMFHVYFDGITRNDASSVNWLRGFQELHAHSVKHLLHTIEHPTLLLSGRLDYLTPSWVMDDMAKVMPNAVHRSDWFSTHFSIVENPTFIVRETDKFLRVQKFPRRFERVSSIHFSRVQDQSTSTDVSEW